MAIRDWPADERPREKLLERGADSLTDAELLALFLRTGVTGKSAVDLARELLDRFGGLSRLCLPDRDAICDAPGLGPAKYAQLKAVMEMASRALKEDIQSGDALSFAGGGAQLPEPAPEGQAARGILGRVPRRARKIRSFSCMNTLRTKGTHEPSRTSLSTWKRLSLTPLR